MQLLYNGLCWIRFGGDEEDRTPGLGVANAALSQLSYIPNLITGNRKNEGEHILLFVLVSRISILALTKSWRFSYTHGQFCGGKSIFSLIAVCAFKVVTLPTINL
jgi:hypothetical protein